MSRGKLTRVEAPSGKDSLPVDAVITLGLLKSMLHSKWRTAVSSAGELVFSVIWMLLPFILQKNPWTKRKVLFSFSSHVFIERLGGFREPAKALPTQGKLCSELYAQP